MFARYVCFHSFIREGISLPVLRSIISLYLPDRTLIRKNRVPKMIRWLREGDKCFVVIH